MDNREAIAELIEALQRREHHFRQAAEGEYDANLLMRARFALEDAAKALTRTEATTGEVERLRSIIRDTGSVLGLDLDGKCPICGGAEGCSHALGERIRAALAQPVQDEGGVIQADRERAAELGICTPEKCIDGTLDDHPLVQSFAAHRRAFSREGGDA